MRHYLTIITLITSLFCSAQNEFNIVSFIEEDGIEIEVIDTAISDENKFNADNKILVPGRLFIYSFQHIDTLGNVWYFKENDDNWKFIKKNNTDSNTVKTVHIGVLAGNPMSKYVPDYNQTSLKYPLPPIKSYSMSGGIENEKNIWIHPPRDLYFSILETNPFPFVKFPCKVGEKWNWSLKIGSSWGDSRWKTWTGTLNNSIEYEITEKTNIETPLGEIEVFIVKSTALNSIGQSSLISYFNPDFGFVKLAYVNIDGSKTNLELIEIK
jgi:hypothetical protein